MLHWGVTTAEQLEEQPKPAIRGLPRGPYKVLGSGFFNEVYSLGPVVFKLAKRYGPLGQPPGWLVRNRLEHRFVSTYVRTPPTFHAVVEDTRGRPTNLILQRRIVGRPLAELTDDELYSRAMIAELERLHDSLSECLVELGWLPDVIGGPPRWGMHDLRYSNNLLVDEEGRIWLIDPGAFFLWFSRRNPLGWVYTTLLMLTCRRMLLRARSVSAARGA